MKTKKTPTLFKAPRSCVLCGNEYPPKSGHLITVTQLVYSFIDGEKRMKLSKGIHTCRSCFAKVVTGAPGAELKKLSLIIGERLREAYNAMRGQSKK